MRVVLSEVREQLSEAVKESALHHGTSATLRVEIATLTRKLAESIRDKGASQTKANDADAQLTKLHGAEKDMRILLASRDKELTDLRRTLESIARARPLVFTLRVLHSQQWTWMLALLTWLLAFRNV